MKYVPLLLTAAIVVVAIRAEDAPVYSTAYSSVNLQRAGYRPDNANVAVPAFYLPSLRLQQQGPPTSQRQQQQAAEVPQIFLQTPQPPPVLTYFPKRRPQSPPPITTTTISPDVTTVNEDAEDVEVTTTDVTTLAEVTTTETSRPRRENGTRPAGDDRSNLEDLDETEPGSLEADADSADAVKTKEDLRTGTDDELVERGVYYIYHPSGLLQRVAYDSKNNFARMDYTARLQYENVEPIREPIYTYDPSTYVFSQLTV